MKKSIAIMALILTVLCSFVFAVPGFAKNDGYGDTAKKTVQKEDDIDDNGETVTEAQTEPDETTQSETVKTENKTVKKSEKKSEKKAIAKKTLSGSFFTSGNVAIIGGCVAVLCAVIYFACKKKNSAKTKDPEANNNKE